MSCPVQGALYDHDDIADCRATSEAGEAWTIEVVMESADTQTWRLSD